MNDREPDNVFKSTFADFAPEVPEKLWEKIESTLLEDPEMAKRKPRQRLLPWAAVAAGLILVFSIWLIVGENDTSGTVNTRVDVQKKPSMPKPLEADMSEVVIEKSAAIGQKTPIHGKPLRPKAPLMETLVAKEVRNLKRKVIEPTTTGRPEKAAIAVAQLEPIEPILFDEAAYQKALAETVAIGDEGVRNNTRTRIGVSTVLNFVVNRLDTEAEQRVRFSETENGILKVDLARRVTKR